MEGDEQGKENKNILDGEQYITNLLDGLLATPAWNKKQRRLREQKYECILSDRDVDGTEMPGQGEAALWMTKWQ